MRIYWIACAHSIIIDMRAHVRVSTIRGNSGVLEGLHESTCVKTVRVLANAVSDKTQTHLDRGLHEA